MKFARDLFLRCMSSAYLFAFASLYVQIPGQVLFGTLPVVMQGPCKWPVLILGAGRIVGADQNTV